MKRIFAVAGTVLLMVLTACGTKVSGPKVNGIDDFISVGGIEVKVTKAKFTTSYTSMMPIGSFSRSDTLYTTDEYKFLIINVEARNVSGTDEVDTALKTENCSDTQNCFKLEDQAFDLYYITLKWDQGSKVDVELLMTVDANMGDSIVLVFWDGTEIPLQKLLSSP
jgi:hypothetical protein